MKLLVFLALVACALAHWPYADLVDKFRMASVFVEGGRAHFLDYYTPTLLEFTTDYFDQQWRFFPWNNQHQPTFMLTFPYRGPNFVFDSLDDLPPNNPDFKEDPVNYLILPSHIAEVVPTSIGTFTVVPHSAIHLSQVMWYDQYSYVIGDPEMWGYDNELFGEQVNFNLVPNNDPLNMTVQGNISMALLLSLYPDSDDDLVDIELFIADYTFVAPGESHLAVFWKISSSNGGDHASAKNLPLSVDWNDVSFEMDPVVRIEECTQEFIKCKRSVGPNVVLPKKEENNRRRSGKNEKKHSHLRTESVAREDAEVRREFLKKQWEDDDSELGSPGFFKTPDGKTTSQIWLTGGYIVAVIGNYPTEYCGGDVSIVATLSILSRHE